MKHVSLPATLIAALVAITAVGGASASAILASANTTTIRAGDLILRAVGMISPTALPADKMAPISVHASGSLKTADGTHLPPAQTLELHVDRHLRVDAEGLASCTVTKL